MPPLWSNDLDNCVILCHASIHQRCHIVDADSEEYNHWHPALCGVKPYSWLVDPEGWRPAQPHHKLCKRCKRIYIAFGGILLNLQRRDPCPRHTYMEPVDCTCREPDYADYVESLRYEWIIERENYGQ